MLKSRIHDAALQMHRDNGVVVDVVCYPSGRTLVQVSKDAMVARAASLLPTVRCPLGDGRGKYARELSSLPEYFILRWE